MNTVKFRSQGEVSIGDLNQNERFSLGDFVANRLSLITKDEPKTRDGWKVIEKYCRRKYGSQIVDDANNANLILPLTPMLSAYRSTDEENEFKFAEHNQNVKEQEGPRTKCNTSVDDNKLVEVVRKQNEKESRQKWDAKWLISILGLKHWLLVVVVVAYAILGGLIFWKLEGPYENEVLGKNRILAEDRRHEFGLKIQSILQACTNFSFSNCETELENAILSYDNNSGLLYKEQLPLWNFDVMNSIFYAATLSTTIGYGHMSCKTFWGRFATMVYSFFGIPLTLLLLNDLGKMLFSMIQSGWNAFHRCLHKVVIKRVSRRFKPSFISTVRHVPNQTEQRLGQIGSVFERSSSFEELFPLPLAIMIVLVYLFGCASMFKIWETTWSYFDCLYFFFVSLSTIGLGDEMPKHPRTSLGFFVFFIIGLALVSMCVSIMYARVEAKYMAALELIDINTRVPAFMNAENYNGSSGASENETEALQPLGVVWRRRAANSNEIAHRLSHSPNKHYSGQSSVSREQRSSAILGVLMANRNTASVRRSAGMGSPFPISGSCATDEGDALCNKRAAVCSEMNTPANEIRCSSANLQHNLSVITEVENK